MWAMHSPPTSRATRNWVLARASFTRPSTSMHSSFALPAMLNMPRECQWTKKRPRGVSPDSRAYRHCTPNGQSAGSSIGGVGAPSILRPRDDLHAVSVPVLAVEQFLPAVQVLDAGEAPALRGGCGGGRAGDRDVEFVEQVDREVTAAAIW